MSEAALVEPFYLGCDTLSIDKDVTHNLKTQESPMSNNFYESLIEQFPVGFVYLKLLFDAGDHPIDLEFIQVNRTYEEMLRTSRDKLLGSTLKKRSGDSLQYYQSFIDRLIKIAKNGGTDTFDLKIHQTERTYKVTAYSPKPNYVYLFFSDITSIVPSLSELDVFFQISPDLLAISRTDGLYLRVNPAWQKILGYAPYDVEV